MRLLIIGGSGFVSGTLAREALQAGWEVTVVTRGQRPMPEGAACIRADRNDPAAFARAMKEQPGDWDLVADCIGMTPEHAEQDIELWSGRAGRFVFVSTDFVYDYRDRQRPQAEYDARFAEEGYGGAKRLAEEVLLWADPVRLPWTILRPSHIYGPGSLLGCLPLQSRDPELLERLRRGEPLRLLDGGRLLQHPIFAADLARTILSVPAAPGVTGQILNVAGPDVVVSSRYYEVIAEAVGATVSIESIDLEGHLLAHPEQGPFCCDRVYDMTALSRSGLAIPTTRLHDGLREQVQALEKAPF
ncbi:MAG: NAD-dependent epimerase/dehydratase family protein [Methylacidiphilales bacterium]|nr:NAD-dependent epimerase/dehydratase family protein [Candidatus Methylacidiphilales bacterium]